MKIVIAEQKAEIGSYQDIRSNQAIKIGDLQQSIEELKDRVKHLESQNSKLLEDNTNLTKSLVNSKNHAESKVLETGELKKVFRAYCNNRGKIIEENAKNLFRDSSK